jgi:hypothetical protein
MSHHTVVPATLSFIALGCFIVSGLFMADPTLSAPCYCKEVTVIPTKMLEYTIYSSRFGKLSMNILFICDILHKNNTTVAKIGKINLTAACIGACSFRDIEYLIGIPVIGYIQHDGSNASTIQYDPMLPLWVCLLCCGVLSATIVIGYMIKIIPQSYRN